LQAPLFFLLLAIFWPFLLLLKSTNPLKISKPSLKLKIYYFQSFLRILVTFVARGILFLASKVLTEILMKKYKSHQCIPRRAAMDIDVLNA